MDKKWLSIVQVHSALFWWNNDIVVDDEMKKAENTASTDENEDEEGEEDEAETRKICWLWIEVKIEWTNIKTIVFACLMNYKINIYIHSFYIHVSSRAMVGGVWIAFVGGAW